MAGRPRFAAGRQAIGTRRVRAPWARAFLGGSYPLAICSPRSGRQKALSEVRTIASICCRPLRGLTAGRFVRAASGLAITHGLRTRPGLHAVACIDRGDRKQVFGDMVNT